MSQDHEQPPTEPDKSDDRQPREHRDQQQHRHQHPRGGQQHRRHHPPPRQDQKPDAGQSQEGQPAPPQQERPPQHQQHPQQQNRQQQNQRQSGRNKTYFFSDAHLGLGSRSEDRAKEQRIIEFLDYVKRDAEQLYIVGDLFDYWFEYRSVVPKGYYRLFAKLAELKDRGVRMTYVVGNHDFWIKSYFATEFGMEILSQPAERTIRGKKFFIHHGDGVIKSDRGYRLLKRILRNRVNIFLFSLLHPDLTSRIARWSSRTSRQYTSHRSYEGNDMQAYASKKIRDQGVEFVIMGHNHSAQFRRIGRGTYVNLGDWITSNTFAVFDGRRIELRTWRTRR